MLLGIGHASGSILDGALGYDWAFALMACVLIAVIPWFWSTTGMNGETQS